MEDKVLEAINRIGEARKSGATELSLSSLGLRELPSALSELPWLERLDVSNNRLSQLPHWITSLILLKDLYLNHNELFILPEWLGQLTQLQSLSISHNKLINLPESTRQLRQLKGLNISQNYLSILPDSLKQLTELQVLFLQNNKLITLPEWIGQLTRLRHLNVSNNQLTTLPISLRQLIQLRSLNLAGNQLTMLPPWLSDFSLLEELYLHNIDALSLPAEILGPAWRRVIQSSDNTKPANPRQILDYYFRVRGDKHPLNEAKLILVGRGAVGKTSLVNRLVHGAFNPGQKKTEGIQITDWFLRLNGNEDVRLNAWDFGGQEIMHATHQFFLTKRSLYLLVLNGREGNEDADADYWLKLIESFGDESRVIIVLNKIKEHPFDVNRRALQQKHPSIRAFVKTDCEDDTGIAELRTIIERETNSLEHLRDAFPTSWFNIKNQLAGMEKNYLNFEEYRAFCEKHGETDQVAQEALASYLHNLGIVLNYKDDPRLQDTHVLNPHWVTNGIYRIINSERLELQKGEIRLEHISKILDPGHYPANMLCFILDLMKKFELCFSFPDDDYHYLIPELLDKQEPEKAASFLPSECLNFQYHYSVLPEGLLPRFIVRTHVMSEGLDRWRTGVILKFEDNQALVKADVQDKKVFISVSGTTLGRRQLLAVIRSDFERIHQDIRNLQPQEMVPLPNRPNVVVPYQKLLVMEQHGMRVYREVVGSQLIELDVHTLLNGVDLEGTRRGIRTIDEQRQAVRLFYSYSHKDEVLRNQLETHLKLLQREGLIDAWYDRKIEAGDEWKQKIDENLERADIILLLVSANFMDSDYCYEKEMKRALERHQKAEARVIPVIVRDIDWHTAPFAHIQPLPKHGKAVTMWSNRDSAWRNVSEGIRKVAEEMRGTSRHFA